MGFTGLQRLPRDATQPEPPFGRAPVFLPGITWTGYPQQEPTQEGYQRRTADNRGRTP
jgi:hypothetical protein